MAEFLHDLNIHGAGQIQFKTTAGANAGKIDQNGNDLVLSNAVGDIIIGNGSDDVFIGDGKKTLMTRIRIVSLTQVITAILDMIMIITIITIILQCYVLLQ